MSRNNGSLKEGVRVNVCFADTSGNMVWSYQATYKNGWFDHEGKNNRHDTPEAMDGTYCWYELIEGGETKSEKQKP